MRSRYISSYAYKLVLTHKKKLLIIFSFLSIVTIYETSSDIFVKSIKRQIIIGNPSIATCPTSNCPSPPFPPVLSTQVIHGRTTKGALQHEWLSSLGMLVDTGKRGTGDPYSGQKVVQYLGAMQTVGAGTAWALNTDSVRNARPGGTNSFGGLEGSGIPGVPGSIGVDDGTIGYELDLSNFDADSRVGQGPFIVGQYVHAQGSFTSLSALYFDAAMTPGKKAWNSGIAFNGLDVIQDNTVADFTGSTSSLMIGGQHTVGVNATAANADMEALAMREGQTICFNETVNCVTWKSGKLVYLNSKRQPVFTVDDDGNATFAGRISQGGGK